MSEQRDRTGWLKGRDAPCIPPVIPGRPYRLVLVGAPGVGKGTQAELLGERLGACHLSTGDIFRAAKCQGDEDRSPALAEALDRMRRGDLVPDATVLDLIRERTRCLRCVGGFLLDGFPRTVAQAEALGELLREEKIALDAVIDYDLPLEDIVARLSGRRTCSGCKAIFHVTARPPRKEGACDHCGDALFQREDDRPASIRVRMEVYEKSTRPLIEYYERRGLLAAISAAGAPEEILGRTLAVLDAGLRRPGAAASPAG
jgi:adenylate kinase